METKLASLSRRYQGALKKHLEQRSQARPRSADRLGREALTMGLETLDLARMHDQALAALMAARRSAKSEDSVIKRAQPFFIEAISRIEKTHRGAMEANLQLCELNQTLRQRTAELQVKNRQLKKEIVERKASEKALKKSEQDYSQLLERSQHMREQLQSLSHRIISAQEEERVKISRELHDEIAQVMMGINLHLATLKKEATSNTKDLRLKITHTQRLVERSVDIVHRFAGQLRPPALDDLGLFAALHAYVTDFAKQTGLSVRFTSFTRGKIDKLDSAKRTVLYRVAQESLANIAKHAKANRVTVNLRKSRDTIRMEIKDDGKSFKTQGRVSARRKQGLGLLGMRERVEMIGGCFTVESGPGQGTLISAEIPFVNGSRA
jgi:signal transduction histidine kinase